MKKIILLITLLVPLNLLAPNFPELTIVASESINPYEGILKAIGAVESRNDSMTYNSKESAVGVYQIRAMKLLDFNKANETNYILTDCFKMEVSRKILLWHLMQYNDMEEAIRAWNGGSNGMNMKSTEKY